MKTIILLAALLIPSLIPLSVQAEQNTDWIFCVITDDFNDAAYFSPVFHGNYDLMDNYQQSFREFILANYGDEINDDIYCTFETEKAITLAELEVQLTDNQDFYSKVVNVSWQYQ